MEYILLLEKGIWYGFAAIGFAIIFNVPQRTLIQIFLLAAIGGLCKVFLIKAGVGVIISSFIGASVVGILSIPAAHNKHAPPLVFSIPALIPMVPGVFGYRTMLGIMKLTETVSNEQYSIILNETINNGIKTILIVLSLAAGASIPMLATRKSSAKNLKIIKHK
jgi:uncharacterized membrane protein YjjB (DUF3815 family)